MEKRVADRRVDEMSSKKLGRVGEMIGDAV